jgi:signal transduction histidine kinase
MPSSSDQPSPPHASAESALLEKLEELSLLRTLGDRLSGAPDFAAACRVLVDLVNEERAADVTAFVSVDAERRVCRLEAVAPARDEAGAAGELDLDAWPFESLRDRDEPVVLDGTPPPWLVPPADLIAGGTFLGVPLRVRGNTTGFLLVYTHACGARLEEDRRLLAIVATSAALAVEVARGGAREEFLAMLRHDINNPVAVALGYTQIIVERLQDAGHPDPEVLVLAGSVAELLKAIADLVANYLHMGAIDRGVPWLHCEDVAVDGLVHEVVERFRPAAAEKGIAIQLSGSGPVVRADRRQLGRVFANLVGNAIKYAPGPGRVDVTLSGDAGGVTVTVADTGYGIDAPDLARLFTRYARFHRDKGIPGTGLGLYLSKAIVEAHGGAIIVSSEVGRGSTFTVRLPRHGRPL